MAHDLRGGRGLILGKAVLMTCCRSSIAIPTNRVIYNVTWKTLIYFVVSGLFTTLSVVDCGRQAGFIPATRSCSRKWCGRISGYPRSFCSN